MGKIHLLPTDRVVKSPRQLEGSQITEKPHHKDLYHAVLYRNGTQILLRPLFRLPLPPTMSKRAEMQISW
jgi:hypothetical protein